MRRTASITALLATVASAGSAYAISHTSDYKTNMQNYRVCTDPELQTCEFGDVVSPSKYYLEDGKTVTVVYSSSGNVGLRIDSATVKTDTYISYPCTTYQHECIDAVCAQAGLPHDTHSDTIPADWPVTGCTTNRCYGGTNHNGVCPAGGHSACPGGTCTGSSTCNIAECTDGPRGVTALEHFCGTGGKSCTSTDSTEDWSVVLRGNQTSGILSGIPANVHYRLKGDPSDGDGCMVVCPFDLASDGTINTSSLSCTTSGDCSLYPLQSLNHVEIRDPDGNVLAIPGLGIATIFATSVEGDPAKKGDCTANPGQAACP